MWLGEAEALVWHAPGGRWCTAYQRRCLSLRARAPEQHSGTPSYIDRTCCGQCPFALSTRFAREMVFCFTRGERLLKPSCQPWLLTEGPVFDAPSRYQRALHVRRRSPSRQSRPPAWPSVQLIYHRACAARSSRSTIGPSTSTTPSERLSMPLHRSHTPKVMHASLSTRVGLLAHTLHKHLAGLA